MVCKIWTPCYALNLRSKTILQERGVIFFLLEAIWLHLHHLAFGDKPKMRSANFQTFHVLI